MIWISLGLVFALACLGGGGVHLFRQRNRRRASTVREGEQVILRADAVSARIYVDKDLLGGPSSGGINRAQTDLVLTRDRLLVATHQGRLLELTPQTGGSVRNTGPNRLVIEGQQPGQGVKVRIELLTDQAEQWASAAEDALKTSRSAA
jgi:hypothetical protein